MTTAEYFRNYAKDRYKHDPEYRKYRNKKSVEWQKSIYAKEYLKKYRKDKYKNDPIYKEKLKLRTKRFVESEKGKKYHKNWSLKKKYGITLSDYSLMLKKQNDVCAICKQKNKNRRSLYVDHCHKTKKVRGLLCQHCNTAIGFIRDDVNIIQSFISYLTTEA